MGAIILIYTLVFIFLRKIEEGRVIFGKPRGP